MKLQCYAQRLAQIAKQKGIKLVVKENLGVLLFIRTVSCRTDTEASAKVRPQTLINRENQGRAGSTSEQCDATSAIETLKAVGAEQSTTDAEESLTSSVGADGR